MTDTPQGLADLPPFVYGTTRLGADDVPRDRALAMANRALDAGLWVHTSDQYGHALDVLAEAARGRPTPLRTVVKLGGGTAADVRAAVLAQIRQLGVPGVALGQLSPVGGLERSLVHGDAELDGLRQLKADGLVGRFVLEVFPWTSAAPLEALRRDRLGDLVDGYIVYLNPLQRFASNDLWDELQARGADLVSMRTVAGGDVRTLRDVPGAAWRPYLRDRAAQVAPVFQRSGVATWVEFCARFALGTPGVRATVGSASRPEHLGALVAATGGEVAPLPEDVVAEITALQRGWADEVDARAEPWTM